MCVFHLSNRRHVGLGGPGIEIGVENFHGKKDLSVLILSTQDVNQSIQLSKTEMLPGLIIQKKKKNNATLTSAGRINIILYDTITLDKKKQLTQIYKIKKLRK